MPGRAFQETSSGFPTRRTISIRSTVNPFQASLIVATAATVYAPWRREPELGVRDSVSLKLALVTAGADRHIVRRRSAAVGKLKSAEGVNEPLLVWED